MKRITVGLMIAVLFSVSGASAQDDDLPIAYVAPQWSPDGETIAFSLSSVGRMSIGVVNADGSGFVNLTPDADSVSGFPVWSPDGDRILFKSNRGNEDSAHFDLWIMDANGDNQEKLTESIESSVDAYAWSPDGGRIAFTTAIPNQSRVDGTPWILYLQSGEFRQLAEPEETAILSDPIWSPSGEQIVFSRMNYSELTDKLLIVDAQSLEHETLESNYVYARQPIWFPKDENRIVVSGSFTASGVMEILEIDLLTGAVDELVLGTRGHNGTPNFSDDGALLTYTLGQMTHSDVEVLDVSSKDVTSLTDQLERQYYTTPTFSSDGTQIAFSSDSDTAHGLWVADLETGTTTQILGD